MSLTTSIATTVLALWVAANVCCVFRIGGLYRRLMRINQFRMFGSWDMFSEPEDMTRYGACQIEYRDEVDTREADGSGWVVATRSPVWRPYGWLMNPQRARAEAMLRLGRALERARGRTEGKPPRMLPYVETAIVAHVARSYPQPSGTRRQVRLVIDAGPDRAEEPIIVWPIDTP